MSKGFRQRFDLENGVNSCFDTAMLIDMQQRFLDRFSKSQREKVDKMIKSQLKVISYCTEQDVPLLVFEYSYSGPTISELKMPLKLVPRSVFLTKANDNGFYGRSGRMALRMLNEWKTQTLYIMGINANACVRDTAEGAKNNGFHIVFSEKTMASCFGEERKYISWFYQNGSPLFLK